MHQLISSAKEIIEEIKHGRMVVLVDEGDGNKEETIAKLSFYRKVDVYEYKFVVREEESAG